MILEYFRDFQGILKVSNEDSFEEEISRKWNIEKVDESIGKLFKTFGNLALLLSFYDESP